MSAALPPEPPPGDVQPAEANAALDDMPETAQLPETAMTAETAERAETGETADAALHRIIDMLQARTGHDLQHYKRAAVLRRIERRRQVSGLPTLADYEQHLQRELPETALLLNDLLLGMTGFFLDRETFVALERNVIPALFDATLANEPLRVWVAACASGEEAYSLAMLLDQAAAAARHKRPLQVFATDIDDTAIARGRKGQYAASVGADIPDALLRSYMTRNQQGYRVNAPLRAQVLFAQHDVLRNPPFSKVDLVSCRHLLVDLDREVQRDILETFHVALRPGGYLLLGHAESAGATADLFSVVDQRHRIYRANAAVRVPRRLPGFHRGASVRESVPTVDKPGAQAPEQASKPVPLLADLHHQMLQAFAPPSVIVNAHGDIVHSHNADAYLRFAPGVPTQSLLALLQPDLRPLVRTALFQATHGTEAPPPAAVRISRGGVVTNVQVTVRQVRDADLGSDLRSDLLLVVFSETEDNTSPDTDALANATQDALLHQMDMQLQRKDEQLQRVVAQFETVVEALKVSNEELHAINEELRSATDELEISKEELQSTNEELTTVNNELNLRVKETAAVNDDLQNLIAATDIATVFVDRDMRIKRFTPAATNIFNILPGDVGRSLLDITHRLHYDGLADDAMTAFSQLKPVEREVGSDDDHWYLARLLPYRTVADRIDGAVLSFIDVTSRLSAERAVDIDRERMELIADSMPDFAILTLDAEGLITSWSAGAARLFGYAEAEAIGQPGAIIFTPEDRAADVPEAEMRTARLRGRALDERWHLRKDGSRIYLSGIMAPMRLGRLKGYAKIARDMTERQQEDVTRSLALTSAVSAAQHAHEASHLKDEFLAVMSHELKHPLNLIQLNAQMLISMPELKDLPAVTRIGKTIQQTVRSQARIIDDLLDVSRTRAGKLVLSAVPLDLTDTLQEGLAWASQHARQKGLQFTAVVVPEPLLVRADPVRIEQVALNLLSNAIKFTPPGGAVTVRLARVGDDALLEVADTGRGIAPRFLKQVFELFQQAEPQPSREEGGLGIGLALVRDLVELHSGSVHAASPGLNQGATFSVRLPLAVPTDFGELSREDGATSLQGLRILYAEDNADALTMLTALLRLEGATVLPAASAAAALELARSQAIDLVITDIGMPRMDGYEFIRKLRQQPATARVLAIALTGYGRPKDVDRATAEGFDGHLNKPVDMGRLRGLIEQLRQTGV